MANRRPSKFRQLNLFGLKNGLSSVFKILPEEAYLGELRDIIELSGGLVLDPGEDDPFAIPLVDDDEVTEGAHPVHLCRKVPTDVFRSSFVYDCYEWERVFDLNPYRVGEPTYRESDANKVLRRQSSWRQLSAKAKQDQMNAKIAEALDSMNTESQTQATPELVSAIHSSSAKYNNSFSRAEASMDIHQSPQVPQSHVAVCVSPKKNHRRKKVAKKEHTSLEDVMVKAVVGDDSAEAAPEVEKIKKEKKKKFKHASVDDSILPSPLKSNFETPTNAQPSCLDQGGGDDRVEDQKETGKLYTCDICSFETEVAFDLVYHLREHTGSRYRCPYCMFRSEIKKELKAHKKLHKSKSQYKCLKCESSTKTKTELKFHYNSVHHGGNHYVCEHCDFQSSTRYHLRIHCMMHY